MSSICKLLLLSNGFSLAYESSVAQAQRCHQDFPYFEK